MGNMATGATDPSQAVTSLETAIWAARNFAMYPDDDEESEAAFCRDHNLGPTSWTIVQRYRRRNQLKEAKRKDQRFIERLQNQLSEKHIRPFLEQCFPGATEPEQRRIREQIERETKWQDAYYEYSPEDMVRDGVKGLRKHHRLGALRHLSHTWEALKGLVAIAVVIAIYATLETKFEVIVVSLLLLSYTTLSGMRWGQLKLALIGDQAGFLRYLELKRAANSEPTDKEMGLRWDLEKALKKTDPHVVADTANSIINLVVYMSLVRALF
jgi:hypothetical protein